VLATWKIRAHHGVWATRRGRVLKGGDRGTNRQETQGGSNMSCPRGNEKNYPFVVERNFVIAAEGGERVPRRKPAREERAGEVEKTLNEGQSLQPERGPQKNTPRKPQRMGEKI